MNPLFLVSTLDDGNMAWRWGSMPEVLQNRKVWFEKVGIDPKTVVLASLVSEAEEREATASEAGIGVLIPDPDIQDADIVYSNEPTLKVMMVVADCMVIAAYDPVSGAVGVAHSGHPGVNQYVPQKLIRGMVERFNAHPEDLVIKVSPARDTHQAMYDDVFIETRFTEPFWPGYIEPSGDQNRPWKVDWIQAGLDQLAEMGVVVPEYPEDTYTGPYFSHRRSDETGESEGRFAVIVGWQ